MAMLCTLIRPAILATTALASAMLLSANAIADPQQTPAATDGLHARAAADAAAISRSSVDYHLPDVGFIREDGKKTSLPAELNDGKPVLLNFIFTSCPSTCPLTSQTLAEFQRKLGAQAAGIHVASISIDPEQDTPARLSHYARKFHAGPEWHYYTGSVAASVAVQTAFDVYRGDKMSHMPVMLMRASPGKPWRRIEGFVTPDELVHDYHELLSAP
jgi:protein SCO1